MLLYDILSEIIPIALVLSVLIIPLGFDKAVKND